MTAGYFAGTLFAESGFHPLYIGAAVMTGRHRGWESDGCVSIPSTSGRR